MRNLEPRELLVTVAIHPPVLRPAAGERRLGITITITNPLPEAVSVELGGPPYISGGPPESTQGIGFQYAVQTPEGLPSGPGGGTWGQPVYELAAGESLQGTFVLDAADARVGMRLPAAGRHAVVATFGRQGWRTRAEFEVVP